MKIFLLLFFSFFIIQSKAQTVGLFYNDPGSMPGYVLFPPGRSDTTYLIDKCGKRIHTWHSNYFPGLSAHLNPDGTLLRCGYINNADFDAGGSGGILEMFDWNSNLIWSYKISDFTQCQHHDAIQLPNGNILTIVWQQYSGAAAIGEGRNPNMVGDEIWSDKIVEIKPVGGDSGTIVWEWHAWDHLIQDYDPNKQNFGVVASHPELLNINAGNSANLDPDWLHCNSLDYDPDLDQILISCHNLSEVWIIDHSTTTSQAASHSGGQSGKGGDFLYRWGNPQNYNRGTIDDQKFFEQHDASWISSDSAGKRRIMIFNNGVGRPGGDYSTVETFTPPAMVNHIYPITATDPYEPGAQDWIYSASPVTSLYSSVQGGAQRLPNGNTMVCEGSDGDFFEVDSLGNEVWEYISPVAINGITSQGNSPFGNMTFRCTYISPDYSGLTGQVLIPGSPIELNPFNYTCNDFATAVNEVNDNNKSLTVYPDPFENDFSFYLPFPLTNAIIRIHDGMGRLLYEESNSSISSYTSHHIHLNVCTGMVMITVVDQNGKTQWSRKLISQ